MRHVITQLWFGFTHEIEITKDEFESLKGARDTALLLASLEDKFLLLLENYEELEQEMMRISIHRMIYPVQRIPAIIDDRRLLNRRLANLLTTCRLYKDHSSHDLSTVYGRTASQLADYGQLHSSHYNSKLGYRVMEAVRNFLQHRSLIISGTKHQMQRTEEDRIMHQGTVNLNVRRLREQGGFKAIVLSELEQVADENGNVDLRPLVREYVSSLAEIHLELRKIFKVDAMRVDSMILESIERLNAISGNNDDGVHIVSYNDVGRISSELLLSRDFVERRHRIIDKTQHVTHYANSYVSSQ